MPGNTWKAPPTWRSVDFLVQLQGGAGVPKGFSSSSISKSGSLTKAEIWRVELWTGPMFIWLLLVLWLQSIVRYSNNIHQHTMTHDCNHSFVFPVEFLVWHFGMLTFPWLPFWYLQGSKPTPGCWSGWSTGRISSKNANLPTWCEERQCLHSACCCAKWASGYSETKFYTWDLNLNAKLGSMLELLLWESVLLVQCQAKFDLGPPLPSHRICKESLYYSSGDCGSRVPRPLHRLFVDFVGSPCWGFLKS